MRRLFIFILSLAAVAAFVIVTPLVFVQQLESKLISVTSPVSPGDDATLTVQTAPGALCLNVKIS